MCLAVSISIGLHYQTDGLRDDTAWQRSLSLEMGISVSQMMSYPHRHAVFCIVFVLISIGRNVMQGLVVVVVVSVLRHFSTTTAISAGVQFNLVILRTEYASIVQIC